MILSAEFSIYNMQKRCSLIKLESSFYDCTCYKIFMATSLVPKAMYKLGMKWFINSAVNGKK